MENITKTMRMQIKSNYGNGTEVAYDSFIIINWPKLIGIANEITPMYYDIVAPRVANFSLILNVDSLAALNCQGSFKYSNYILLWISVSFQYQ